MRGKLPIVVGVTLGWSVLYCGESAMHGIGSAGRSSISDIGRGNLAHADTTCCTPTATIFTPLWRGTLRSGTLSSPDISVGTYREIVIYQVPRSNSRCPGTTGVLFRANSASPYGYTNQALAGRIQVQGSDLKIQAGPCGGTDAEEYVVAGVSL